VNSENRIPTNYIHAKKGWPVVISQGLGDRWSIYLVKPNGSLQRCKQYGEYKFKLSAQIVLHDFPGKTLKRK